MSKKANLNVVDIHEIICHYINNGMENTLEMYNYKQQTFNKIEDDAMTITVKSAKYGEIQFKIDTEDYDKIKDYKWCVAYMKNNKFYVKTNGKRPNRNHIHLHRIITDAKNGFVVDHINGDTLDNRKKNLRVCLHHENMANRNKSSIIYRNPYTSKYKGVSYNKKLKKYIVQTGRNMNGVHKTIFLGSFDCEIEAAKKYNEYALKEYGKFAKLNNIKETI